MGRTRRRHRCIAHEKRLKRWHRDRKFAPIERTNPEWHDMGDSHI
jgi:putative endonuclease